MLVFSCLFIYLICLFVCFLMKNYWKLLRMRFQLDFCSCTLLLQTLRFLKYKIMTIINKLVLRTFVLFPLVKWGFHCRNNIFKGKQLLKKLQKVMKITREGTECFCLNINMENWKWLREEHRILSHVIWKRLMHFSVKISDWSKP